jgi:hypothetical protein
MKKVLIIWLLSGFAFEGVVWIEVSIKAKRAVSFEDWHAEFARIVGKDGPK